MVDHFESDLLAEVKNLLIERDTAIKTFQEARAVFLRATYELGSINSKIANVYKELKVEKNNIINFHHIDVSAKQKRAWTAARKGMNYEDNN